MRDIGVKLWMSLESWSKIFETLHSCTINNIFQSYKTWPCAFLASYVTLLGYIIIGRNSKFNSSLFCDFHHFSFLSFTFQFNGDTKCIWN